MYVCMCFGVTDDQVNAEIAKGARSMREISGACGAGTDCGRCVKTITAMIPRDMSEARRARPACPGTCAALCATHKAPQATEAAEEAA